MIKQWMVMMMLMLLSVFGGSGLAGAEETVNAVDQESQWEQKMQQKQLMLYKELSLSGDQQKQLDENKNSNRQEIKALYKANRELMNVMREELQKDELNMGEINRIQAQLKETKALMLDARLKGILEVRKILTPEQFKKFMDHKSEHGGFFKHRMMGKDRATEAPLKTE